ncbi:MAG: glycosyltransferase family 4 protein [Lachnospiraceae bacterium]|nr:glycosyltransferase family 4 protein [Lachnospiraceae bacterium]
MKVLNLLTSGDAGGIESLCRDMGEKSTFENGFCFLFRGGSTYEQMRQKGLKTYCFEQDSKKLNFHKYRKLKEIARGYDIIVVHHGDPFLKLYYWLLSKSLKKKFVTYVHSCYEEKYFFHNNRIKKLLAHFMFQLGLDCSDRVIFVSEAGRRSYMSEFRIPDKKSVVVYNGIGLDKLIQGKEFQLSVEIPYNLTFIGRLSKEKGLNNLLAASAVLRKKYDIKLSIVGKGEERVALEQLAEKLNIKDIVEFYGEQQDITPFLKSASIFIYPSVFQEVFGIAIVEAMAFGIPCVAYAVGGIPEIVEDRKTGYLANTISVLSLSEKIEEAIKDIRSGAVCNISEQAKEKAESFSIGITVDKLKRIYDCM